MAYKSGHIYLIDHEPIGSELATFSKPVQFDICVNGLFHSVIYDKNGNRFVEDRSKIVTGFIKVGEIVQNENQISIGVHPSGFNHWRIGGQDITTNQASVLEFEPVADGQFRTDFIVGNSAGGIFILPGEAGNFPIKPNKLNYPQLAFFTEVLITPDGLSGGITLIYTTETMSGNGEIENPLDVVEASAEKRGTMSATHFSKLENINLANYMPTSHAANGITNQNINNWNTGYGWGNHANAGYALITDVNGKLDKTLATAQSVLSSVTFSGNVSAPKIILQTQVSNTTVSAIWSDGGIVYYNGSGGTPKAMAFATELKYGSFNPPTLAQLATLGIKRGDYYIQTADGTASGTEIQRAPFNGVQITSWTVTSAVFNTLSPDQKNAVKSIEITM